MTASEKIFHERMLKRNAKRDAQNLNNRKDYVQKTDFTPPFELEKAEAVDKLIIFDTNSEEETSKSLNEIMKVLKEDSDD